MTTIRTIFVAIMLAGTMASAQDAPPPPTGSDWSDPIRDVFLPSASSTTLRPETDIAARWSELPQADRDKVKADCAASRTKDGTAESGQATPSEDEAQTAHQADAGEAISLTQVVQICRIVDGLS
jgi:hypothetical protein